MNLQLLRPDPGSFRDPSGRVYVWGQTVLRTVAKSADWFEEVWASGVLQTHSESGRLIHAQRLDSKEFAQLNFSEAPAAVLIHPRLPFISYPYEWPFAAWKAAALAHLDLHLALLDDGFTLSDATAFNMQFVGPRPLHIDILSVIPYQEGGPFAGYAQFQRQFLNPLVLEATTGVSFAPVFRASLDGISSDETLRLLPWLDVARLSHILHIALPAIYDRRLAKRGVEPAKAPSPLPKSRLIGLLKHLRATIEGLTPSRATTSIWADYEVHNTYVAHAREAKRTAVSAFCDSVRPATMIDIGCNTGEYSAVALGSGATRVIGIDTDRAALDKAFLRATSAGLDFLPLQIDLANPPPDQGWAGAERASFRARLRADGLLALAVLHHLVIGRNVPLADALAEIVSLAPVGLIEFVPKSDPQAQRLLRNRTDIFDGYTLEACRSQLSSIATIVDERPIPGTERVLFWYARQNAASR